MVFLKNIGVLLLFCFTVSCSSKKTVTTPKEVILDSITVVDPTDIIVDKSAFEFKFIQSPLLSPMLDISTEKKKMVFLDLNASWCTPCKMMQRDVYTHQETADFFNDHFLNYMVDVDKNEGPDLKMIYEVKVIPTLLFLDGKGRVVHRIEGALYHKDLIINAEIALEKYNKRKS